MLKNIKIADKFYPSDIIYHLDINKQRHYQWEISNKKNVSVYQEIDKESYGMFGDLCIYVSVDICLYIYIYIYIWTRNQCVYVLHNNSKTKNVCLTNFRILLILSHVCE